MDRILRKWVRDRVREQAWAKAHGQDSTQDGSQEPGMGEDHETHHNMASKKTAAKDQAEKGAGAAASGSHTAFADLPSLDGADKAFHRFCEDDTIYREVLESFAANTPLSLEQASAALPDDLARYATEMHGLKSAAQSIGADKLGATAAHLEEAARTGQVKEVRAGNAAFVQAAQELVAAIKQALAR
jgi:HPt (histidine-containing phosphotransfer) domain-containing protein